MVPRFCSGKLSAPRPHYMVECVSPKIQSKEMAKAFPFPRQGGDFLKGKSYFFGEKNQNKLWLSFSLSRTNFSVPFRRPLKQQCGAKWICNLFKQLSLFLFGNTFYLPPSPPPANVTVKCTNAAMPPIQTNAGQIYYNSTKWMWMKNRIHITRT